MFFDSTHMQIVLNLPKRRLIDIRNCNPNAADVNDDKPRRSASHTHTHTPSPQWTLLSLRPIWTHPLRGRDAKIALATSSHDLHHTHMRWFKEVWNVRGCVDARTFITLWPYHRSTYICSRAHTHAFTQLMYDTANRDREHSAVG